MSNSRRIKTRKEAGVVNRASDPRIQAFTEVLHELHEAGIDDKATIANVIRQSCPDVSDEVVRKSKSEFIRDYAFRDAVNSEMYDQPSRDQSSVDTDAEVDWNIDLLEHEFNKAEEKQSIDSHVGFAKYVMLFLTQLSPLVWNDSSTVGAHGETLARSGVRLTGDGSDNFEQIFYYLESIPAKILTLTIEALRSADANTIAKTLRSSRTASVDLGITVSSIGHRRVQDREGNESLQQFIFERVVPLKISSDVYEQSVACINKFKQRVGSNDRNAIYVY